MRKLVLGLIALTSVQFAFVTYTMVLKSPVELTSGPAPTQPAPTNHLARIEHSTSPTLVSPQPEIALPQSEPRQTQDRAVTSKVAPGRLVNRERFLASRASKPAFNPAPSDAAAPVEFDSVVIRYNRNPATANCESQTPKMKNRSYIAKAVPVIKKPWEWIKTIASKLN